MGVGCAGTQSHAAPSWNCAMWASSPVRYRGRGWPWAWTVHRATSFTAANMTVPVPKQAAHATGQHPAWVLDKVWDGGVGALRAAPAARDSDATTEGRGDTVPGVPAHARLERDEGRRRQLAVMGCPCCQGLGHNQRGDALGGQRPRLHVPRARLRQALS